MDAQSWLKLLLICFVVLLTAASIPLAYWLGLRDGKKEAAKKPIPK